MSSARKRKQRHLALALERWKSRPKNLAHFTFEPSDLERKAGMRSTDRAVRRRVAEDSKHPPRVVSDPGIMGGTPCLSGSRLPAQTLLGMVDAGDQWERIVEGWPWLTRAHVEAARAWQRQRGAQTPPVASKPRKRIE